MDKRSASRVHVGIPPRCLAIVQENNEMSASVKKADNIFSHIHTPISVIGQTDRQAVRYDKVFFAYVVS